MYTSKQVTSLNQLMTEQQQVCRKIDDLRLWWTQNLCGESPNVNSLCGRLHALRQELATHFQHEESTERAILDGVADFSQEEHFRGLVRTQALFLADLDQMLTRIRTSPALDLAGGELNRAVDRFLMRLCAHEEQQAHMLASLPPAPEQSTTPPKSAPRP